MADQESGGSNDVTCNNMEFEMEVDSDQVGKPSAEKDADHQFVMPTPPLPVVPVHAYPQQIETGFSEDPSSHNIEECIFMQWVNNRVSILTNEEAYSAFLEHEIRIKGKNKLAPIMDKVEEEMRLKVAGPFVQNYLAASAAAYDKHKSHCISLCQCPQARSGLVSASATPVAALVNVPAAADLVNVPAAADLVTVPAATSATTKETENATPLFPATAPKGSSLTNSAEGELDLDLSETDSD